jgi:hypothetical protein
LIDTLAAIRSNICREFSDRVKDHIEEENKKRDELNYLKEEQKLLKKKLAKIEKGFEKKTK